MKSWGRRLTVLLLSGLLLSSCADVSAPGARNLDVQAPTSPQDRKNAINERPDSVIFLPLGSDVLVPESLPGDPLPQTEVGPFELRSETLAGALQLILADYEIPLAFETDQGLTRTITVANLRGPMGDVVKRVCSLADLYCSYEDGVLVIKDSQTFTVTVPPLGGDTNVLSSLATGLEAITGTTPITDEGTRTIVYTATNRTAQLAERYFQKIRSNTALIIYEIYIWQVSLDAANSTGINWEKIQSVGKFNTGIQFPGGSTLSDVTPISIGLPTTGPVTFGASDVFEFISTFGAVKTVSQPQVTMLSGGEASLRVAETRNYVSQLSRTVDNGETSVSSQTDKVDSGFTLKITSAWDNATVYGTVDLSIQDFLGFKSFSAGENLSLQLPEMTENQLTTQVRVRPGDSLLIAGLVQSDDQYSKQGPGFMEPLLSLSRSATVSNSELVILLRPRVVVYTAEGGKYNEAVKGSYSKAGLPEANPDVFGGGDSAPASSSQPASVPATSRDAAPVSLLNKPQEAPAYPQGSISWDLLDPAM